MPLKLSSRCYLILSLCNFIVVSIPMTPEGSSPSEPPIRPSLRTPKALARLGLAFFSLSPHAFAFLFKIVPEPVNHFPATAPPRATPKTSSPGTDPVLSSPAIGESPLAGESEPCQGKGPREWVAQ
ncbi:hypothetical protein B0T10DRAFT_483379 [Thelonectria olida]|uniref:Uncharacterized protein n=1 Tax=Thelonectria olida TaxID=1576542 RepID=A0A9P8W9W4_9HYPO|nr:hypothetical protein B0T10DRAFT_483379 [Thelonectria olida]